MKLGADWVDFAVLAQEVIENGECQPRLSSAGPYVHKCDCTTAILMDLPMEAEVDETETQSCEGCGDQVEDVDDNGECTDCAEESRLEAEHQRHEGHMTWFL